MKPGIQAADERQMRAALDLARRGEGLTRPNPPVGAVVVRRGRRVGQGFHRKAGGPHAEIDALRQAGRQARGATLYVTLEPCCTWGRTPPCTDAIIQAGIARVVAATTDPNPRHRGKGLAVLRRAGVRVSSGVCEDAACALIAPFQAWISMGRPYVTLKLALTLDGKIADYQGTSKWITGPRARRAVQGLRRRCDAVMVGAGTVRADDPSLLPRPAAGRQPYRVIVDSRGRLALNAAVLNDGFAAQTIIATTAGSKKTWRTACAAKGAQVWVLPRGAGGVSLPALLKKLHGLGALHVLCEGGSEVAASLIAMGGVDEYIFFVAPRIIGGRDAVGAVGGRGWRLERAPELDFVEILQVGRDLVIRARPRR